MTVIDRLDNIFIYLGLSHLFYPDKFDSFYFHYHSELLDLQDDQEEDPNTPPDSVEREKRALCCKNPRFDCYHLW